jgi:abnormal spindle-like microcephaly-associated protein
MPLGGVHRGAGGAATAPVRRDDAMRNFAALRVAADALGGVPAVLTGEEFFHERGADERVVVLLTALLCHRLLEAHAEDRAAMVIQRHFRRLRVARPGTARDHLHRWIQAAAVVQRGVRAWLARVGAARAAQERRRAAAAATVVQAAWRGRPDRQRFLRQRAAAVQIQAAWRGKVARRAYFDAALAPKVADAALQRHRQLARRVWQARAACAQLEAEHAAATVLQAAWRGHRSRAGLRRQRAAAVAIQAAFRVHRARGARAQQRAAATALQAAYRGWAARQRLDRARRAAVTVQRFARGLLARREARSRRAAAVAAQRLAADGMRQQMLKLAAAMEQFAARTLAAKCIQAGWKAHRERQAFRAALAERVAARAQEARRQDAARAVIASWAPVFRDRGWFLRARRAAQVLQRCWRRRLAERSAAATVIQKNVRAFLAAKRLRDSRRAALAIQAAFRGHAAREGHPKRARLQGIRGRLRAAAAAAAAAPHTTFGARVEAALQTLAAAAAARRPLPLPALLDIAHCTACSRACCDMAAAGGALASLLGLLRSAGRDKLQGEALRAAMAALGHICKYGRYAEEVFAACAEDGTLLALVELLQHHREREVSPAAGVRSCGAAGPAHERCCRPWRPSIHPCKRPSLRPLATCRTCSWRAPGCWAAWPATRGAPRPWGGSPR